MEQVFVNMPVLFAQTGQNKVLYHLIVIVLAAIAAFIPRYFPVLFFSTRKIPEWFNEWMKYVPVSLFTALVIKNVFIATDGYRFVPFGHVEQIYAAIIVIVVAYFTRSMSMSVISGLVAVWLLSLVI